MPRKLNSISFLLAFLLIFLSLKPASVAQESSGQSIRIPVVFHVVGTILPNTSLLQKEIDNLNEAFNPSEETINKLPANIKHIVGRSRIRFQLVDKDPNGNFSPGYTESRTDESPSFWMNEFLGSTQPADKVKKSATGHPGWDRKRYLNIWICPLAPKKWLGYAYRPNQFTDSKGGLEGWRDGVVMDVSAIGLGDNSLVHEVGHYFNLYHPWGDDDDKSIDDDFCDDTPKTTQEDSYRREKGLTYNLMTYVADRVIFTKDQVARMEKELSPLGFRYNMAKNSSTPSSPIDLDCDIAEIEESENNYAAYYVQSTLEENTPIDQRYSFLLGVGGSKKKSRTKVAIRMIMKEIPSMKFSDKVWLVFEDGEKIAPYTPGKKIQADDENIDGRNQDVELFKAELRFKKSEYQKVASKKIKAIHIETSEKVFIRTIPSDKREQIRKYFSCIAEKLGGIDQLNWGDSQGPEPTNYIKPTKEQIRQAHLSQLFVEKEQLMHNVFAPGAGGINRIKSSPDGSKLIYQATMLAQNRMISGFAVLNPMLEMKYLYSQLKARYLDWSPDSKKLIYLKSNVHIVYNFSDKSELNLHTPSEGQYWFWVDEKTIMFKLSGAAYSLDIYTKESKNYSYSQAENMYNSLTTSRKTQASYLLEKKDISNKPSLVAYSLNKSYGKVLLENFYAPGRIYELGQPHYFVIEKNKKFYIVLLGLKKPQERRFSFSLDINSRLNEEERKLYLSNLKNNIPIYGLISGSKLNPYNKEPMGSDGKSLFRFKIIKGNEKEGVGLISFQYQPETPLKDMVISQLQFYRKHSTPNYSYDTKEKFTVNYRFHKRTGSGFWLKVEPHRDISSLLVQNNPSNTSSGSSNPSTAASTTSSKTFTSSQSNFPKANYWESKYVENIPYAPKAKVMFLPVEVSHSCSVCKKHSKEMSELKDKLKSFLERSQRWKYTGGIPTDVSAQYTMELGIADFAYESKEVEDKEGKKSTKYRANAKISYKIVDGSGRAVSSGNYTSSSGSLNTFYATKEKTFGANLPSIEKIVRKIVYRNFPLIAQVNEVKEANKKGVPKVLSISTNANLPSVKNLTFNLYPKASYEAAKDTRQLASIGSCKIEVLYGSEKAACKINKGGKKILEAIAKKEELVLISNL